MLTTPDNLLFLHLLRDEVQNQPGYIGEFRKGITVNFTVISQIYVLYILVNTKKFKFLNRNHKNPPKI